MADSGGIQEETTILTVPCLTLRENTERPVTISEGTNRLVTPNAEAIVEAYREQLAQPIDKTRRPQASGMERPQNESPRFSRS